MRARPNAGGAPRMPSAGAGPGIPGIYLDYNATAPVRPEAAAAMADALGEVGNPSSVHRFGRAARKRVEDGRKAVAALIGASARDIVFTATGTEANALAIAGAGRRRIVVSAIEHDSVLANAAATDPDCTRIGATSSGIVDLAALAHILDKSGGDALVSLMLANNETGVLQPVAEAARLAHAKGALIHCDAIQAAGKIAVDVQALGVDLLSLSAHKLGGPQGIGALYVREGVALAPLLRGGGQERYRRAGTENVPGIAGFGAAAAAARRGLQAYAQIAAWRDRLEAELTSRVPAAFIAGGDAARLPNTSCIVCPGLKSETQVMALDLAGIAVSAGSACSSGKVKASHVLDAMGFAAAEAGAAIRVSLGWMTEPSDIEAFVRSWTDFAVRRAVVFS